MSNRRKLHQAPMTPEQAQALVDANPPDDPASAVVVGYVHESQVAYTWHHSMAQLLAWDANNKGRIWRGGFVAVRGGTDGLAHARNTGVKDFLANRDAGWLWWVDTDMGFAPDTVDRLLEVADPVDRPVVGGMCFGQREREDDGLGGFRTMAVPTVMDWTFVGQRGGFEVRWDYPRDTVTRCHGTGSACILIHRGVFERVRDEYGGGPQWASWYARVTNPSTGELVSEDLSFCMRLMRLDIPLYVHTGVQTTHLKNVWLAQEDYWRQRALAPPPVTSAHLAPVPPVPVDARAAYRFAVAPTHNRPDKLAELVASLAGQADEVIILDNACDPPVDLADVTVLADGEQPPNLARFWNVLLDHCAGRAKELGLDVWDVAVLNDDAVPPAGWYDTVSTGLRGHESAAVAHTGTVTVSRPELRTETDLPRDARMCPWAFVTRGELGLRADETMRWWYFDDDFDRNARLAGGVLHLPGPPVANTLANSTTGGALAVQARRDQETFAAKWAGR